MTTHLRARTAQAGAFLALVTGLVTGIPTAALAAAPTVTIDSVSDRTVSSGSTVTISYTVSNPGGEGETGSGLFETDVTTSAGRCNSGCHPSDTFTGSKSYTATLTAPTVAAGEDPAKMTITVISKDKDDLASAPVTAEITVEGPAAPTTVRLLSGRIKDDKGARVSGVQVVMEDSQGHNYRTTTDSSGGYSFASSDATPIAVGSIRVAAAKAGYEAVDATVQGIAGRTVNVSLTIKKTAVATSPTPSTSTSPTATPTDDASDDPQQGSTGVNNLNQNTEEAASSSDDGGSNWLLIVMGALLVAAGIGVMVLVWMRRKKAEELSSDTGIGQTVPASVGGGGFDATRVAAPVGAGRGVDATMIAPAAGMGARSGGLGDAPTVIHRPVEDEFPDPYGAPLPSGGNYGGNQWNDQQGGGAYGGGAYGGATQTYGQQQGGTYGAQGGGGGYPDGGGQQRFDEHTNLYQPEQPQRFDEHTNLYQPEQGGGNYGDQGGYDQGGYDQGGYDQGGYDQGWNGQDAGGHGPQGGYDQQGVYHQGGYPQQGGTYGGYDQGGYDQQQGAHPQQQPPQQGGGGTYGNGYPQQPPQQGGGTYGQRPNRDWDDN